VGVGQSFHHPQIGLSLSSGFFKRKLRLAGLDHFRRGVEKDDKMRTRNETTNEASQPKRSPITVTMRVDQQVLVVTV